MAMICRMGSLLAIVTTLAAPANGQDRRLPVGGPFSPGLVLDAPFSAEATTRIQEVTTEGTARVQTVTARYYRDSRGQVRGEVDTPWGPYVVVASQGPEHVEFYVLDLAKRRYRSAGLAGYYIAAQLFNGESGVALPVGKVCFQVAPRVLADMSEAERLEGLRAANAQVSPDLGIVTASHSSDEIPSADFKATHIRRSIDYELTNIRREEPPATLFQVPSDFTFGSIGDREDRRVILAPRRSPPSACEPTKR